jgi:DNA repair exonuclease SbcCD ATPase subunit
MPFYIDQDDGWTSSWNSFAALDTLPQNPKRKILEYYVGMRPENYYQTQAAIDQAKIDMRELRTNRRGIVLTSGALKADFPGPILPVDFSNFEQEIARLTKLVAEQQGEEESRLKALIALHNDLAVVESQLRAIRRVNEELRRDFAFASTTLPESVQCPTCNAVYDNDFASRFEIVDDAQRAIEMISELEGEKARIVEEVAKTRPAHQAARKRYEATRDLLQQTRDSVSLSEIISSRATEIVGQVLNTAIGAMDTRLDELLREKANLEAERRGSIDSRRVRAILDFLNQEFARLAQPLHVAAGPVRSLALPFGGLVSRAVSHGHIPAACLARSTESRIALADLRQTKGLAA